uniref:Uncharacterized protein n=1 Tax=Cucumis melo TaxID=3656 RepID=A0A9I9EGX3_CUCME
MKVGANSDIHWVLFDEENRAAGFHSKSGGLWFFLYLRVYQWSYNLYLGQVKEVVCARFLKWFGFEGREELNRAYRPRMQPRTMIYEIFINYMIEILSLRLEITMCTLRSSSRCLIDCLSLLKLQYRLPVSLGLLVKSSRQIQVQKSVVHQLHAIFRSKVASTPGGGVTLLDIDDDGLDELLFLADSTMLCIEHNYLEACFENMTRIFRSTTFKKSILLRIPLKTTFFTSFKLSSNTMLVTSHVHMGLSWRLGTLAAYGCLAQGCAWPPRTYLWRLYVCDYI